MQIHDVRNAAVLVTLLSLVSSPALAQASGGVRQSGAVSANDCTEWVANNLIKDAGAVCGSGGSITWPTTADVVISNSTNSPAGVAPVGTDCLVSSSGAWVAGSCGSTSPGGSSGQVQFNNSGAFGGLTNTQLTADINTFTSSLSGAVPVGGADATLYLNETGAWTAPLGGAAACAPTLCTFGGLVVDGNGTSSLTSPFTLTGTPYSAGSGTTNTPYIYYNCSGATAPNNWSTSGTLFGMNSCGGFSGDYFKIVASGALIFRMDFLGDLYLSGNSLVMNGTTMTSGGDLNAETNGDYHIRGAFAGNCLGSIVVYGFQGTSNPFGFSSDGATDICGVVNGAVTWLSTATLLTFDTNVAVGGGSAVTAGTGAASVTGFASKFTVVPGTAVSSITVNFTTAWASAPTCTANASTPIGVGVAPATGSVTFTTLAAVTGGAIYAICMQ